MSAAIATCAMPLSALNKDEEFPAFSENSVETLKSRYLNRENGRITETPDELFRRVATTLGQADRELGASDEEVEAWTNRYFWQMRMFRTTPNSPCLMNAGRPLGCLMACWVVPIPDNMEGIMKGATDTALIQRAGGGCGYSLDDLRASGSHIASSGGTTSGPISFWRMYSEVTQAIQQGAFRRGANMAMMSVTAPDILKFLFAKQNLSQFTNYNISVKLPDWFMQLAVRTDRRFPHLVHDRFKNRWFTIPKVLLQTVHAAVQLGLSDQSKQRAIDNCYSLQDLFQVNVPNGDAEEFYKNAPCMDDMVSIQHIFDILVTNAHATGEPGVCFIDRIRETEPTPHIGLIQTSNPCGEAFLLPDEACVLASVALQQFVKFSDGDFNRPYVDWPALRDTVQTTVRMLDNMVQINKYPTPETEKMVRANRKIGLGVMGLADALFKLGLRYDSDDGRSAAENLMEKVNKYAMEYDRQLAVERGPYPNWNGSRRELAGEPPLRNAEVTSVAPTGTISIIADCSCGIEPLFSLAFMRNVLDGKQLLQLHPFFEAVARRAGFWRDDLPDEAMKHGSIQHVESIPQRYRDIFRCAHDISPSDHILMQAAIQRHTSNAVSKTINLPHDATVADVRAAFLFAHAQGCKATTVYRDGCRASQPMQLKGAHKAEALSAITTTDDPVLLIPDDEIPSAPELCSALRIRQSTAFGHLHATVVYDRVTHRALELFAQCGSNGDVAQADLEGLCRLSSLLLRGGYPVTQLIAQLMAPGASLNGLNLPRALGTVLIRYVEELDEIKRREKYTTPHDSSNGNGNGRVALASAPLAGPIDGYRIKCPSGNPRCVGGVVRNGLCSTCQTCGASSCT